MECECRGDPGLAGVPSSGAARQGRRRGADVGGIPEGLRQDVERYLQGLTRVRRSRTGQRIRPLKPSSIRTRRAELAAAARMAVKAGVPISTLSSLSALLAPEV